MFENRQHAGRLLAEKLVGQLPKLSPSPRLQHLVVGVGHRSIPVAQQVALRLHAPLCGFAAELIPTLEDDQPDMGAVCACGLVILAAGLGQQAGHQNGYLGRQVQELSQKARADEQRWRNLSGLGCPTVRNTRAIIVEDAITSGHTTRAALLSLKQSGAKEIILASPVVLKATEEQLARECDLLVSIITAGKAFSTQDFYREHHDVNDQEVIEALKETAICCQRASDLIAGLDNHESAQLHGGRIL